MRMYTTLALCLAALSAPAFAEQDDHVTQIGEVRLLHGWARESHGSQAQVYFEVDHQGSTPATLTGARTDIATNAAIYGAPIQAGQAAIALGDYPLDPGQEFDLGPEGVFILLDGLTEDLHEGDTFELMVEIAPFGEAELHVEIVDEHADGHAHAGHNH